MMNGTEICNGKYEHLVAKFGVNSDSVLCAVGCVRVRSNHGIGLKTWRSSVGQLWLHNRFNWLLALKVTYITS